MLEDIQDEIIEELPAGELSEVLPDPEESTIIEEYEPVEELPINEFPEELTDIPEGELSQEEIINEPELVTNELEDATNELLSADADPTATPAPEDDPKNNEEEILSKITEITETAKIIQANQKTGTENLTLLSTCSLSILCMIFGGFVIHCFLNRLG